MFFLLKTRDLCNLFIFICNDQIFNNRYAKGKVHFYFSPKLLFASNTEVFNIPLVFKIYSLELNHLAPPSGPRKNITCSFKMNT